VCTAQLLVYKYCFEADQDRPPARGGELKSLPDDFLQNQEILETVNQRWNRNVLLMGDFNDEPFDKSITRYLGATSNVRLLREWNEILELERHIDGGDKKTDKQHYLEYPSYLYNCMWRLLPDGAHYYWKSNDLCISQSRPVIIVRTAWKRPQKWYL